MAAPLLVELLTEELPPKALRHLGYAFADALVSDLRKDGFVLADSKFIVFATPRRLGVLAHDVAERAPDREVVVKGPSVKVGLGADGTPSAPLLGFAKKQGVPVDQLERLNDGKQEIFAFRSVAAGASLEAALATLVEAALRKLPTPKVMRWGDHDEAFVRPVHGLVMLHGERIVPGRVLGQESGRTTRGHRFMGKGVIEIPRADAYEALLEREGKVIANFELRARKIREELARAAGRASLAAGDALYDEVTALVEWPAVYEGHFEKAFLEVPQECLMLTMKQNQKYFPLIDGQGKLLNRFLIVSNMAVAHPGNIVHGNERVLRARLADAKFFYDQDRRASLESRVPGLANVVFLNKLGSQLDRVERVTSLATLIARKLGTDEALARRAARLCKADLLTAMVGEFPELQGIMGMHYARHDGEPEPVAAAIEAHYRPRFAGDSLPQERIGACVALADKLDTLVGLFGIGQPPTGDKDPFGLRRHALGVVRILVEQNLPLSVRELVDAAFAAHPRGVLGDAHAEVTVFVLERLRGHLRDAGYSANEVEAVLCLVPVRLDLVPHQLAAVRAFADLPEAESLAAANKRVVNILKQAAAKGESFQNATAKMLKEPGERALFDALKTAAQQATPRFEQGDFTGYLKAFAVLKTPVDAFFDSVMVMVDDHALRQNRLALLADLRQAMNKVADISKLAA
ncbi:MAG TPA: glycine--tRNA ligase subunit beta [Burkholderiales bacterium]|nr:glycine--tRNA ligase subunit beta [Burkholderiales bacterium]